jgi:epsilon-lactone hydrolase
MPPLTEDRIRSVFPIIRFVQSYLPQIMPGWLLKQSITHVRLGDGVTHQWISVDGVACQWVIPQDYLSDRVLLYLHGGGFIFGLNPMHLLMGAYLARKMGMRLIMVDYRLAPKHPFPAALDDCVAAYSWLLKQGFSSEKIVTAGDSAGGNLTVTSMMKMRDSGIPLPAAGACLSPAVDFTERSSQNKDHKDPLLPPRAVKLYTKSYLGNNDAHNPLISPVYGNLSGLPPLLVHVGEDEILCESAMRLAERAKADGVDVRLEIYPRMWHVWQLFLSIPQATQSLDDIAQFLCSHIADFGHL